MAAVVICLAWGSGSVLAAAPRFAQVALRELPTTGSISEETVTLAQMAGKYRISPIHQAESLLVYLWEAHPDWKPPLQPVFLSELALLDESLWDRRLSTKITPISVVIVYGDSEAERERVYRAIQQWARGKQRIPTFVALDDVIKEAVGGRDAFIPAAFVLSTETLAITASRGDEPVRVNIWAQNLTAPQGPKPDDPPDIPPGCEASWFRRHLARVVRAGIMEVPSSGLNPKAGVSDVEFIGWLSRISAERASRVLSDYDVQNPQPLSRERAITATVRFLYGDDLRAALALCPPPISETAGGQAGDYSTLWEKAFARVPGASNVTPGLRTYLELALAKGLLYDEPSLHARWPLTRGVAAWLLSHALEPAAESPTGLVVDAIDVPIEQDLRFGRGEIACEGPGGEMEVLYPARAATDRLPIVQSSYPLVQYLTHEGLTEAESPEAQWLVGRVGENPLVVRATKVGGGWALARRAVVSSEDAEAIRALNRQSEALDDWKVAFLFGRGAQLVTPRDKPLPRDVTLSVQFNSPMEPATLAPENVWLQRHDRGERVSAKLTWDALPRQLDLKPEGLLAPGVTYDVVVGAGVRAEGGEPLTPRRSEALPAGASRAWCFTTENLLRLTIYVSHAPDGAKVYLPGRDQPSVMPLTGPIEAQVPPGSLAVRLEYPDGRKQELTYQVAVDGLLEVTAEPPVPARVLVEGAPKFIAQGESATITLRAVDSSRGPLQFHKPVKVTLEASGCRVSPGRWLMVAEGKASFSFSADQPGRIRIAVAETEPSVPVTPAEIVVYCRYAAPPSAVVWSPVERHRLSRPERGGREVMVVPRLQRWLAQDASYQVRVLDSRGEALTRISGLPGLPGRREFWVDENGALRFHASAAGQLVDICYQYREGRGGVLVTGVGKSDVVKVELERLIANLVREVGYQPISSADLAALWPDQDAQLHAFSAADVKLTQEVFGLSELLVADLTAIGENAYELGWTIWSVDPSGPIPWSSRTAGVPSWRFQVDRSRTPPFNPDRVEESLRKSLVPWLQAMGMRPSATLVSQPSPTPF